MKKKYSDADAQKKAMREGYHAVEFALRSLAEQAQDLRMGYDTPEDKPERLWIAATKAGKEQP